MSSLKLILVGKTGAGKSSAGNTILGKEEFKAGFSFNALTTECQKGEAKVDGRTVTVVDTPGVTDLAVSREDAKDRVAECFPMSAPGPHAFLLVIKFGRFTPEEKQAAEVIEEVFGEAALEHTMLLFTKGDELEDPDDLLTLLKESKEMRDLLNKLNWRYHIFNNKMNDHPQVIELLNKIDKMVGERGHYTSELFQKAEEKRKEEQEKERMRREEEELKKELHKKPEELKILLIGNTTASNRTASKLILKERHQYSDRNRSQKINGEFLERRVSVVETPGLREMRRKSEERIVQEIQLSLCLTSPGPHAFVIVEGSREESAERKGILELIKCVFGVNAEKYVILLAIESSENSVQSFDYDSHSAEHPPLLKHHISKAPREHLLPYTPEYLRNRTQVTSLLKKIDEMVERNGKSPFTSKMYLDAEEAITKIQDEILANRRLELTKKDCKIIWEGKDGYVNSNEWKIEIIKARKQAEKQNSSQNNCITAVSVAVGGVVGAAVGAVVGFIAGGTAGAAAGGAIGTAGGGPVGTAVGVPAGAAVGAKAGTVSGASKGAATGVSVATGITAGVVGATAGGVVGGLNRYRLRKICIMQ